MSTGTVADDDVGDNGDENVVAVVIVDVAFDVALVVVVALEVALVVAIEVEIDADRCNGARRRTSSLSKFAALTVDCKRMRAVVLLLSTTARLRVGEQRVDDERTTRRANHNVKQTRTISIAA